MTHKILLLAGDGIGPEIMEQAKKILTCLKENASFSFECEEGLVGGAAIDASGKPLPNTTYNLARESDAILLACVGGPKWDTLPPSIRPEQGLLQLRKSFELFANLRPAILYSPLVNASTLKKEIVEDLNLLIVRELTGDIYFGEPRGQHTVHNQTIAFNTMLYSKGEIERIARIGFALAKSRNGQLCSVDKANVLEVSQFWREIMIQIAKDYPEVHLTHMYVDNAAMQLIKKPKQFDVIVTSNLFGDILSDSAAMLTGSIGMLPSASLNASNFGLYEPVHGSAPDLANLNQANPLGLLLSLSMMLRYSLDALELANLIERAIQDVLQQGYRTMDIYYEDTTLVSCSQMGDKVVASLQKLLLQ